MPGVTGQEGGERAAVVAGVVAIQAAAAGVVIARMDRAA